MKSHQFCDRKGRAQFPIIIGIFAFLLVAIVSVFGIVSTQVSAGTATSTVKVLNTPPQFEAGNNAYETVASTSTSPTTFGTTLTFGALAKDSGSDSIYLLVCRTNGAPTASSSTAPSCNGGAGNLIAVSAAPYANTYPTPVMTYATSSAIADVAETQNWYAFLCDVNNDLPKCSTTANTGTPGNTDASPYSINHPHAFTALAQNGPVNPGATITFTATATESPQDVVGGIDTAKIYLCRAADFTGTACGVGGTWATTTVGAQTNPTAALTFPIPSQDGVYQGYSYIIDNHNAPATGASQGASINFTVNNVAPTVTASTITYASTTLTLTNPLAETTGFGLTFTVSDNNSCVSTSSAPEMPTTQVQLFRSDLAATCVANSAAAYNSNNCYTSAVATTTWNIVCSQVGGSCTGATDLTADWTCTFPLWSNAEPTTAGTPWAALTWDARVSVTDNNGLSGNALTDNVSRQSELQPFTYMNLGAGSIDFGAFEPGFGNTNLGDVAGAILGVESRGNTALDVNIQVTDMCPNFVGSCAGDENSNTIYGTRQHYGTSSVAYAAAGAYTASTSSSPMLDLNVKKPTATSTATSKNTYWGIFVPATLVVSGDYKGVDTLTLVMEGNTATW